MTDNPIFQQLADSIKAGKRKDAQALTQTALDQNIAPGEILNALSAGMEDVGQRFKTNEIFVPEVLIAARAMKSAMELLEPALVKAGNVPKHTVIIGTVEGDLHDIGKNLVAMMLRGAQFNVVDLGINISPAAFVEAAKQHNADLVALSALLTTTMPSMKVTVEALKAAGAKAKTMIGGAPITQAYADSIGAAGYSADAASAVDLARQLVA